MKKKKNLQIYRSIHRMYSKGISNDEVTVIIEKYLGITLFSVTDKLKAFAHNKIQLKLTFSEVILVVFYLVQNNTTSLSQEEVNNLKNKLKIFLIKIHFCYLLKDVSNSTWFQKTQEYQLYEKTHTFSIENLMDVGKYSMLNKFISWNIKNVHNMLFNAIVMYIERLEHQYKIPFITNNNIFLTENELHLYKKYFGVIKDAYSKKGKTIKINYKYLIITLVNDYETNKILYNKFLQYDKDNNNNITKQITRYLKEISCYLRVFNILDIGLNSKITSLESFEDSEQYFIALNLLATPQLSNTFVNKCIQLFNHGDHEIVQIIIKNLELFKKQVQKKL